MTTRMTTQAEHYTPTYVTTWNKVFQKNIPQDWYTGATSQKYTTQNDDVSFRRVLIQFLTIVYVYGHTQGSHKISQNFNCTQPLSRFIENSIQAVAKTYNNYNSIFPLQPAAPDVANNVRLRYGARHKSSKLSSTLR